MKNDKPDNCITEVIDDRDEENPDFEIDPMFSGTHADGGKHREIRHKELDDGVAYQ